MSLICLVWDLKPPSPSSSPINYLELKTAAEPSTDRDLVKFERKLLKFWAQSFLLGVPKIIVGFRTKDGMLVRLEELETQTIPEKVKRGKGMWDGNVCIGFAAGFLECRFDEISRPEDFDNNTNVSQGSGPLLWEREYGEFERRKERPDWRYTRSRTVGMATSSPRHSENGAVAARDVKVTKRVN